MTFEDIIKNAVDLHLHIGPEVIPRKFTVESLVKQESGKIAGIALKNHFYPTISMIKTIKQDSIKLIGSIVLNNYVGGLNPDVIYGSSDISEFPIIVWFPTIHAKNFLEKSEFEIPPEWVNNPNFKSRKSSEITPVKVIENDKITEQTKKVLEAIKNTNSILATGHLTWQEAEILATESLKMGIKTILTHPIYQRINMPIEVQKKLTDLGAYSERCFSMYSIDKIPIEKIASQIKELGAEKCIISSDVGQAFSKPPSEALEEFTTLLHDQGISKEELKIMLVDNPNKLITK